MNNRQRKKVLGHIEKLDCEGDCPSEDYLIRRGAAVVDALIEACRDLRPMVRVRAGWALGVIGDPRGYEAIMSLVEDPDERVVYDAVWALGYLRDPRALPFLLENMGREGSTSAYALAEWGPEILEPVEAVLQSGSSKAKCDAMYVVRRVAPRRAIELLKPFLDDPDPNLSSWAADQLEIAEEEVASEAVVCRQRPRSKVRRR